MSALVDGASSMSLSEVMIISFVSAQAVVGLFHTNFLTVVATGAPKDSCPSFFIGGGGR